MSKEHKWNIFKYNIELTGQILKCREHQYGNHTSAETLINLSQSSNEIPDKKGKINKKQNPFELHLYNLISFYSCIRCNANGKITLHALTCTSNDAFYVLCVHCKKLVPCCDHIHSLQHSTCFDSFQGFKSYSDHLVFIYSFMRALTYIIKQALFCLKVHANDRGELLTAWR